MFVGLEVRTTLVDVCLGGEPGSNRACWCPHLRVNEFLVHGSVGARRYLSDMTTHNAGRVAGERIVDLIEALQGLAIGPTRGGMTKL